MAVIPLWYVEAQSLIGVTEIAGKEHHPEIVQLWKDIKRGGIKDDETAWCAALVGGCLERADVRSTRFESAISYADWGEALNRPAIGAIAVFKLKSGNHVTFIAGVDKLGNYVCLGGNQGNKVKYSVYPKANCIALRWPAGTVFTPIFNLPVLTADGNDSTR